MKRLELMEMAKLPVWAQRHIGLCYDNMDSMARDKHTLFEGEPDSGRLVLDCFHGVGTVTEHDQPLREHQRIKFFPFGRGERSWANYIQFGIDLNREGEMNIHGSDVVSITPHATNSFNVSLVRERR